MSAPDDDTGAPPIFTLGFEFTHALMGKCVPTLAEWKNALAESAWDLRATSELGIANSVIFDLRPTPAHRPGGGNTGE